MAKQFDAASKHIIDTYPADWVVLGGLPPGKNIEITDTDLSAVSAAADKLILVHDPDPYVAHIEFQAGPDSGMDGRVLVYNVLARRRFNCPVRSVVFLLRPEAQTGATGHVSDSFGVNHRLEFSYKLVRVWELAPDALLKGGIGTLALTPISAVKPDDLPAVIEKMKRRLDVELPPNESRDVWLATQILMGLRYSDEMVQSLVKGLPHMEESTTYQAIIEKGVAKGIAAGRALEARDVLLRGGRMNFGEPDSSAVALLNSISDQGKLEALMDRLLSGSANSWAELLNPACSH